MAPSGIINKNIAIFPLPFLYCQEREKKVWIDISITSDTNWWNNNTFSNMHYFIRNPLFHILTDGSRLTYFKFHIHFFQSVKFWQASTLCIILVFHAH